MCWTCGDWSLDLQVNRLLVTHSGKKSYQVDVQDKSADMSRVAIGQSFLEGRTRTPDLARGHLLQAMRDVSVDISPGEDPPSYRKGFIYKLLESYVIPESVA